LVSVMASPMTMDDFELAEALASDEVCAPGDDSAECGLELRQLRAQHKKAHVKAHVSEALSAESVDVQASSDEAVLFGPDVEGQDMWAETTYDQILLGITANLTSEGECLSMDTGGSCSVFGCKESRGATECKNSKCMCASGYCAQAGTCFPKKGQCLEDTGGTCSVATCSSSRGATKCSSGKCLCKLGGCSWKGKCYPLTDTGGTCSVKSCATSRGPTTCHRGRCICKNGYVAVQGSCQKFTEED